jgi:two-component sensor histidine kinase/PAS domain-containing protein
MESWSPSGLPTAPQLQWGSHLAHFFEAGDELHDLLVPYFKAGLENNERCLWVTGEAFNADRARSALRAAVPDFDRRERAGQIEIADGDEWYAAGQKIQAGEPVDGLLQREQDALELGYAGLRTNGNCAWVTAQQWADFQGYEALVQKAVRGRRMICLCSYCTKQLRNGARQEVMERHDTAVPSPVRPAAAQSGSNGATIAPGEFKAAHETAEVQRLRSELARQKRAFDFAMTASDMGTWRYTLADNVCVYDDNARRLYGLTEARFLHDAEGVKSKFHPDDLELMWARVAEALDPASDGRYDVEYRVRQLDGSWRWLSAWGLVEFEGEGFDRKPVAIAGASRDLTQRKQAEGQQRLLLDELNHRVKNTLATVQAITTQTLRTARDLPSAREAVERRIHSMAQAHDLLTSRSWKGANMTDVVARALEAFTPAQVQVSGEAVELSSRHTLALSLALHELATNATKYGALSCPGGSVIVTWAVKDGKLRLDWEERGGPPVAPPSQKGFGTRLLEVLLVRDLGGSMKIHYEVSGVRCRVVVAL